MWWSRPIDEVVRQITQLDRIELTEAIQSFPARFRLDFTGDYLAAQSDERLRHLLLAAVLAQRPHN
ncbi:MAG: hypothetical protein L6Q92_10540 [Phycisphaerae bacterium]|nr:hypothetical protein [Phycisphaerae bacterium]